MRIYLFLIKYKKCEHVYIHTTNRIKLSLIMARKTREEALVTKEHILNAAETLFLDKGVSYTSLHQIAETAGVTRGAIYWHFKDKVDLLQALLDRAILPIDEITATIVADSTRLPEEKILVLASKIADLLTNDERLCKAVEIITYKVELAGEFAIMHERHMQRFTHMFNIYYTLIEQEYKRRNLSPSKAQLNTTAHAVYAICTGLFHNWIFSQNSFDFHKVTKHTIKTYLHGLWASDSSL